MRSITFKLWDLDWPPTYHLELLLVIEAICINLKKIVDNRFLYCFKDKSTSCEGVCESIMLHMLVASHTTHRLKTTVA